MVRARSPWSVLAPAVPHPLSTSRPLRHWTYPSSRSSVSSSEKSGMFLWSHHLELLAVGLSRLDNLAPC